jgi:flagellar operon protein
MTAALTGVQPGQALRETGSAQRKEAVHDGRFGDQLEDKLRISGHAAKRMRSRGLELAEPDMDRLSTAVDQAGEKGSNEALILMDGVAFVVSVPNRTVITAHSGPGDRVYTNIDSTIVLGGEK